MAIHIITRTNKKRPPRFQVQRYEAGKPREALGHLPSDFNEAAIAEIAPKLAPEEQLMLDNFVGNMRFNQQHFNLMAGVLPDREILYLPPEFHQAVFKAWQFAKRQGIAFNPHEIMLNALLEKTEALQVQRRQHQEQLNERLHTGGQALFQALTTLDVPLQTIAERFRVIADERYGKKAHMKKAIIEEYAAKPARYSLWYCGVAIDVLLEYGKNPLTILPAQKIVEHWSRLRVNDFSEEKLKQEFFKQFKIPTESQSEYDPLFKNNRKSN